jgi:hypothetical protein
MHQRAYVLGLLLVLTSVLQAQKRDKEPTTILPSILWTSQFVHVTSMTGDEFNISTYPEDRAAIETVRDAIREWGRYTLVYKLEDAELIVNVRAGRQLEAGGGARTTPGSIGGIVGAGVGPADDYVEILMPIPTGRVNEHRATVLWQRGLHNGLGDGAPLIQEFRKEAEAAAANAAQAKKEKKP